MMSPSNASIRIFPAFVGGQDVGIPYIPQNVFGLLNFFQCVKLIACLMN